MPSLVAAILATPTVLSRMAFVRSWGWAAKRSSSVRRLGEMVCKELGVQDTYGFHSAPAEGRQAVTHYVSSALDSCFLPRICTGIATTHQLPTCISQQFSIARKPPRFHSMTSVEIFGRVGRRSHRVCSFMRAGMARKHTWGRSFGCWLVTGFRQHLCGVAFSGCAALSSQACLARICRKGPGTLGCQWVEAVRR